MKLILNDRKALSQQSEPCTSQAEVDQILEELLLATREPIVAEQNPIGLAAPQIGIFKQVCIVWMFIGVNRDKNQPREKWEWRPLVNPKVIVADGLYHTTEGCISFPNQRVSAIRFEEIVVSHGLNDQRAKLAFSTLGSHPQECIAVQHEISHLKGLTMFDFRPNKLGRNTLCPCGSGKKNKKCCGLNHWNDNLRQLLSEDTD